MNRVYHELKNLPLYIDDQPRLNVGMLHARVSRDMIRHGIKLAVIDHLQYVRSDIRGEERQQIQQVVDDIKAMAKRLGIPVILVSHVTRPSEYRPISQASDIRLPTLNILYGSSAIEKAADMVVFVHRPIWYLERSTPLPRLKPEWEAAKIEWEGKAQLVLPKRRGGKGYATRLCDFDEPTTWFSDVPEIFL
jgi:replicative DNA helicase